LPFKNESSFARQVKRPSVRDKGAGPCGRRGGKKAPPLGQGHEVVQPSRPGTIFV
jgi:hypothetical protein